MEKFKKLDRSEMRNVMGGSEKSCSVRCDQDKSTTTSVTDCSRDTVQTACGDDADLSKAVCICA